MNNGNSQFYSLISDLLDEYQTFASPSPTNRLVDFILGVPNLSNDERRALAYAALAEEFTRLLPNDDAPTIEAQLEKRLADFAERSFPLDRRELLKRLVLVELAENFAEVEDGEEYKKRFPELCDDIDQYFSLSQAQIYSRTRYITSGFNDAATSPDQKPEEEEPPKSRRLTEEYEIQKKIGAGGQKSVYCAEQKSTGQRVALKNLNPALANVALNRRQMKSEVVLQARLSHPNIPQILSYEDAETPLLVERLIANGKTWESLFDSMSFDDNLAILIAVSQIVAYAHKQQNIIHCDLKPENVMLGENNGRYNDIYLVDWGFAISLDDPDLAEKRAAGTLFYLPPETFAPTGTALSYATDVFTLGGILFRLLTARAPYENYYRVSGELLAKLAARGAFVPEIDERHPKTDAINPLELVEIAKKALRKDPKERYADAAEFAEALERYRRRANLGERLAAAQDAFARRRSNHGNTTVSLLTLIETANEFRLLREETARSDANGQPSNLFWRAVASEWEARDFLIRQTLESQDLNLAESQIEAARLLEETLASLALPLDANVPPASSEQYLADLKSAREKREREQQAERALVRLQAEHAIAQIQAIEHAVAPIAEANWRQGEVALRDFINAPNLTATNQHLAERSGIFLEAVSPRRVVVNSLAFSADEKYIAILGPVIAVYSSNDQAKRPEMNARQIQAISSQPRQSPQIADKKVSIFSSQDFVAVAQFPLGDYDGKQRLVVNPAFVDETRVDPKLAARFLLCRDNGVVFFLRFDETGATTTSKVDFRVSESTQGRAPWGTPRLAQSDDSEPLLIVADASGAASFYALPDGRLLRKVQLCDAVGDAIPVVQTTPNGRTLFCAAPDGSFKRWSAETDAVETLDLPLSADADLSLGGVRRSLEISPDGQTLYASDESGKFVVWNVAAKKPIYVAQEPVNSAQCERVDVPTTTNFISQIRRIDADRFLTLGFNDRWRVWDLSQRDENGVPTSVELRDENAEPSRGLRVADVSPSKRYLALADNSHNFALYDLQERRAIARSEGALFSVDSTNVGSDVAYNPRTDRLLVGTLDYSSVAAFDPKTMRLATKYAPYPDPKSSLVTSRQIVPTNFAIPETGDEFAAAFESGDVFFFKDGVSEPVGKIENAFVKSEFGYDEMLDKAFSEPSALDDPDFQEALFGANQVGSSNVALLAASPDGTRLVGKTMTGDQFVLWDWKTRTEIKRWRVAQFDAPREKLVASLKSDDQRLALKQLFAGVSTTVGLAFVSETELLEIKADGVIVRRDVETGEPIATIPAPRPNVILDDERQSKPYPSSFRLSNDRSRLALGFSDGVLTVVDLKTNLILFTAAQFAEPLPKRDVGANRFTQDFGALLSADQNRCATGLAWSRDDNLLCATFGNGRAVLLEAKYFTPLETFVVADAGVGPKGRLYVSPFFTRDDKLLTFDTHGFMKRWDFRPSPEKPTRLDGKEGADYLSGTSRPNLWASVRDSATRHFSFVVRDGDKEIYRRENVEWFQRITEPGATRETFLLLGKDGLLSTIDETGAPVETGVDWNLNSPGAPEAANGEIASPQESAFPAPKTQTKLSRLLEEFIKKRPDGDYPREEFERLLAETNALENEASDDEIVFEDEEPAPESGKTVGFLRVAAAPNRRAFAAIGKKDGALYALTLAEADAGWRLVALPQNANEPFSKLAFRPDSRELAAIETGGDVTFVPFDVAPGAPDDVVWSQKTYLADAKGASTLLSYDTLNEVMETGALVYSSSGRYLLQVGAGSSVWIWDAATRSLIQSLALDLYARTRRESLSVSGLAPLRLDDRRDAFVVAGSDGVLRFYQTDASSNAQTAEPSLFAQVYTVSPTTLSDLIESPESAETRAVVLRRTGGLAGGSRRLFWELSQNVNVLATSPDGKTLYVGSPDDVRSFDLDEIRRNIENLPEYWRDFDVESATGLRYSPAAGFQFIERDRFVSVEPVP